MRSLTFFLVIMMMTMSITSVIAQNSTVVNYGTLDGKSYERVDTIVSITYADESKPQIPESLIGQYLQKGRVSFLRDATTTGYTDLIFSLTTEMLQETWTKNDSGVTYSTRVVSGKETAWWMICAVVSIFLIVLAQQCKRFAVSDSLVFFVASAAAIIGSFSCVFVEVAGNFFILPLLTLIIIPSRNSETFYYKIYFIFFYICMILSIILMYYAF